MAAEHPDIIAAAKAVYELRRKTAYGVGVKLGPWDGEPNAFQQEVIAEVKAVFRLALNCAVSQAMQDKINAGYLTKTCVEAFKDMSAQRLRDVGIDP